MSFEASFKVSGSIFLSKSLSKRRHPIAQTEKLRNGGKLKE
jgi:hypothetical protein